jgi:hypothetical protein
MLQTMLFYRVYLYAVRIFLLLFKEFFCCVGLSLGILFFSILEITWHVLYAQQDFKVTFGGQILKSLLQGMTMSLVDD